MICLTVRHRKIKLLNPKVTTNCCELIFFGQSLIVNHTILSVWDLRILSRCFLLYMLNTTVNMQIYGAFKWHLTWNVRKLCKIFLFRKSLASKLSVGALNVGMWHLLFPLISLENLVKIGRCGTVSLLAAQLPHCFHSCLACRTRLKVEGR